MGNLNLLPVISLAPTEVALAAKRLGAAADLQHPAATPNLVSVIPNGLQARFSAN